MQQSLAVFTTAKLLALSAMGAAASAASAANAASLSMQLNEPYLFFYLQLPLWFLFIAMIVLTFASAFLSLTTDYMRARGTKTSKFSTALIVGFVISFVALPTFITEPSPGLMMLTASVGAFSGTSLLYLAGRLVSNKELHDAVIELIINRAIKFLGVALDLVTEHATKLLTVVLTSVVASFVIVPQLKTELNANSVLQPALLEVINVNHS